MSTLRDGSTAMYIRLCGLVFVTDHDWNQDVALKYMARILAGDYIPPIHVRHHDGRYHVVEGRHRVVARLMLGRSHIPAKVWVGCNEECPCHILIEMDL